MHARRRTHLIWAPRPDHPRRPRAWQTSSPASTAVVAAPTLAADTKRYVALDAYRGFIMLLLASEGFGFSLLEERPDLGTRRRLVRSRALGRPRLLGPDPAGVHVHGRRRHALRAGRPHGSWRHRPRQLPPRRGSIPPPDHPQPGAHLGRLGPDQAPDDHRLVADRVHLLPQLRDHAVEVALAGGERHRPARLLDGAAVRVSGSRRAVLEDRPRRAGGRPLDLPLRLRPGVFDVELHREHGLDADGRVDGPVADGTAAERREAEATGRRNGGARSPPDWCSACGSR